MGVFEQFPMLTIFVIVVATYLMSRSSNRGAAGSGKPSARGAARRRRPARGSAIVAARNWTSTHDAPFDGAAGFLTGARICRKDRIKPPRRWTAQAASPAARLLAVAQLGTRVVRQIGGRRPGDRRGVHALSVGSAPRSGPAESRAGADEKKRQSKPARQPGHRPAPAGRRVAQYDAWEREYGDCNGILEQVYPEGTYFNFSPFDYDRA